VSYSVRDARIFLPWDGRVVKKYVKRTEKYQINDKIYLRGNQTKQKNHKLEISLKNFD